MRRWWIFQPVAVLLLVAGRAVPAAAADPPPDRVAAIFAPLADARSPGLAVLVRHNGRTLFARGYGVRDLESFRKIDAATDFRLASFTKQFTAMAVMLLAHDGKLQYHERLTDIFPGFPVWGQAITIRHLLTHTSGLPDYEDVMDHMEKVKGPIWTVDRQIQDGEVLSLLEQQTAGKFAPGSSWSYSNSAYVVLGLIVARVSGEPFAQFLRDRIFQPLQMTGTLAYMKGRNTVPERACGHSREGGRFAQTDQSPTSATLGDGGVYSNLRDLAKWDAAIENHTLLGEDEMRAALTPVRLRDGAEPHWPPEPGGDNLDPNKPVSYGFGWFLDPWQGRPRMWHSGTSTGFRTVIERFTRERLTVVVLCNRADLDPAGLALRTAQLFLK